jgi:DNA-binding MarR family transcriptional regulator
MPTRNPLSGRHEDQDSHIVLGILHAIETSDNITQRTVASELGVALGLVNAYLKRCVKKGLIKVRNAPARRYAYYLTPKGFAEKSKLTAGYFAYSFSFFRAARADCDRVLDDAAARRMKTVALVGASELAEIITLCAADRSINIVGIVDHGKTGRHAGLPVVATFGEIVGVDGLIVSDLADPKAAYDAAVSAVGADRVLAPALLSGIRSRLAYKRVSSRRDEA